MVPGLREVMWSDMDHFMLDAGLRVLGIDNRKPGNKKALEKMRNDWLRIKRQLLRNNNAIIMFCNVYFSISMDYPIGRLEKCYAPILRNSDRALDVLFEKASVSKEQVAAVVLAGENCEYPFVQRYLEKYTGKIPEMVNMPEFVAARGAVLYEKM